MADNEITDEGIEKAKAEEDAKEAAFDPSVLQRVFEATTKTGAGAMSGGELIPRKRLRFTIIKEDLAPDRWPGDIQVQLVTLTSAQELSVTKDVTDPTEAIFRTAKASLEQVNGAPIPEEQMDTLWELLGPGGRQLVLTMYQRIGTMTPTGMGKAEASCTEL